MTSSHGRTRNAARASLASNASGPPAAGLLGATAVASNANSTSTNRDIGFVKPGDKAVLKIESFPFTRYGTIEAIVTRVARDAIPQPDADQIEEDGTRKPQAQSAMGGQRMQNLVFAVTLRPDRKTIAVDGTQVHSAPEWPSPPKSEPDRDASSNTSSRRWSKSRRRP